MDSNQSNNMSSNQGFNAGSNQNFSAGYAQVPNTGYHQGYNAGYNQGFNGGYHPGGYNQMANIPEEYRPISMWGYFGYQILFSIPLVGFILLIVFSFGGTRNYNLRNFARSYFCILIILFILLGIFFIFFSGSLLLILGNARTMSNMYYYK